MNRSEIDLLMFFLSFKKVSKILGNTMNKAAGMTLTWVASFLWAVEFPSCWFREVEDSEVTGWLPVEPDMTSDPARERSDPKLGLEDPMMFGVPKLKEPKTDLELCYSASSKTELPIFLIQRKVKQL